jgi:hypothetical protein
LRRGISGLNLRSIQTRCFWENSPCTLFQADKIKKT